MKYSPLRVVKNEASPKEASIYLYGIIGDFWFNAEDPLTSRNFLKALSALEQTHDIINVHINSPGGDVFEGLAICNAIKASKKEIHTWNDSLAASMGAAILLSAKKGNRHAAKASMLMLHNASTITWGHAEDMRNTADMLDATDATLANIIADAAEKPVANIISNYMNYKDHWMSAEEAAAEGFVLVADYAVEDMPPAEDLQNMQLDKVAAFYHPKINNQINNPEMSLFKNKFPKMAALAKVAAADLSADAIEAINTEIAENEIEGVTLVLDAELEELATTAEKVPALEAKIKTLEPLTAENIVLNSAIATLTAKVAEQKALLDAPGENPEVPGANGDDSQPGVKKVVDEFETSFDRELKALK